MNRVKQLLGMAAAAGLEVHAIHMPPGDLGYYSPDENRIYFNIRCTPMERRSVVAHELGHHHYGHECDDSPAAERQADAFAARLLIEPGWYEELERINPDAEWIAEEMNVTPEVIADYRRMCLQRIGGTTYATPRMGSGQWAHRA